MKDEKLYLTEEECLQNDTIYTVDNNGEKKYIRLRKKNDSNQSKIEDEEVQAVFPSELTAGFWLRFFSFILDSIIAAALGHIIVDSTLNLLGASLGQEVYSLLKLAVYLLYFTISNLVTGGQTLAKVIFGLRVVRMDGKDLDFTTVFIREFAGRLIHKFSFLFVLYLITTFTDYNQNLSDLFADTTVIDLSKLKVYEMARC